MPSKKNSVFNLAWIQLAIRLRKVDSCLSSARVTCVIVQNALLGKVLASSLFQSVY